MFQRTRRTFLGYQDSNMCLICDCVAVSRDGVHVLVPGKIKALSWKISFARIIVMKVACLLCHGLDRRTGKTSVVSWAAWLIVIPARSTGKLPYLPMNSRGGLNLHFWEAISDFSVSVCRLGSHVRKYGMLYVKIYARSQTFWNI